MSSDRYPFEDAILASDPYLEIVERVLVHTQ